MNGSDAEALKFVIRHVGCMELPSPSFGAGRYLWRWRPSRHKRSVLPSQRPIVYLTISRRSRRTGTLRLGSVGRGTEPV